MTFAAKNLALRARVERGGFPLPFTHLLTLWRLCGDHFASTNAAALSSTQVVRLAGQRRRAEQILHRLGDPVLGDQLLDVEIELTA